MPNKEIEKIRMMIEDSNHKKNNLIKQKEEREKREKAEKELEGAKNKKILEDSGIISLFKDLVANNLAKEYACGCDRVKLTVKTVSCGYGDGEHSRDEGIEVIISDNQVYLKTKSEERSRYGWEVDDYILLNQENMVQVIGEELTKII